MNRKRNKIYTKTAFVSLAYALCLVISGKASASEQYRLELKCPFAGSSTIVVRFLADDDLDAFNEAQKILDSNSRYKGKACVIIAVKRD